MIHFEEYDP
jgi:hypothetical protein